MYKITADIPCECGCLDMSIESGFVGFMGDMPCSEDYGKCCRCGKSFINGEINKRFFEEV